MEFLKKGTKFCPYCGQPLKEENSKLYCFTEGCRRAFEIYSFEKKKEENV